MMTDRPLARFFERHCDVALTFDDVRLKTGYSEVMPEQVDLTTRFSRQVPLKMPIVSAAMDRVTEHVLATSLAMLGGLGIIHRNMMPQRQADEVARVKYHLNGLIAKPICVQEDQTVRDVLLLREKREYTFRSFLVLNRARQLVGVLTGNDFDFCEDSSSSVSDVMTREVQTAPVSTSLRDAYQLMLANKHKLLPLVDEQRLVQGLYTFSDASRIVRGQSEGCNLDDKGQLRVGAAVGTGAQALERAALLAEQNVDVIVIDTAHADSRPVLQTLELLKAAHPTIDIVVGNVSEPESARRLADAGADGIRVGQGPGSICTTRVIAGVGSAQVSAVYYCVEAVRKYDVPVCADGGIRYSGDIPIAIGAGASSVMLGKLLAGTKEAPGEILFLEGRQWKEYRGMGSHSALMESESSRERYLQSHSSPDKLIPEGIEARVPYQGELAQVVHQYVGGLRQGMGYVGAASIAELQDKADFHLMTTAGRAESHPHDVSITKAAPNYDR